MSICYLTLWRLAEITNSRTKTTGLHVALRKNFSSTLSATDLVKGPKDVASLLVCTRKQILLGGYGFFVSSGVSGSKVVM